MHDRARAEDDRGDAELDRDQAQSDRHNAGIDELTGAKRRGIGIEDLRNEIDRGRREGDGQLVLAYVDVDGLKTVNDTQGHPAGDEVLRAVAAAFSRELRSYDVVVRMGGDEFLTALPNVTLEEAKSRFEGVRRLGPIGQRRERWLQRTPQGRLRRKRPYRPRGRRAAEHPRVPRARLTQERYFLTRNAPRMDGWMRQK